jgi:cyanophycinase
MKGSLVIIGGGLRYDNDKIFNKIVELAGGREKAFISIIPTASNHPQLYGGITEKAFKEIYNIGCKLILIGNCKELRNYETEVYDENYIERIRNSSGVYFIGGLQHRIPEALFTHPDGGRTPLLQAIWDVYEDGGVIGGTSAGAAIMSEIMFEDGEPLDIMKNGAQRSGCLGHGLGFIGSGVFIDQHFFAKGRFGRMLVAMAECGYTLGIGIAENTAVIVTEGEWVEVVGYKGACVLDLSQASINNNLDEFNITNAIVTYLDRGDKFNLKTKKTYPSHYKLSGIVIKPNAEDFVPYNKKSRFYGDILANRVLRDLMWDFIDNKQEEVIGLAFSLIDKGEKKNLGFEFKFRKTENSIGYYTGVLGSEDYTVIDIHFDVRPIKMNEPLFGHIY